MTRQVRGGYPGEPPGPERLGLGQLCQELVDIVAQLEQLPVRGVRFDACTRHPRLLCVIGGANVMTFGALAERVNLRCAVTRSGGCCVLQLPTDDVVDQDWHECLDRCVAELLGGFVDQPGDLRGSGRAGVDGVLRES